NAAAEQRSLSERKLLGYDGKLVLMDERAFGEASQPEALEQGDPVCGSGAGHRLGGAVSTPDVCTGRSGQIGTARTLRTTALEILRRDLRHEAARRPDPLQRRSPQPRDQARMA